VSRTKELRLTGSPVDFEVWLRRSARFAQLLVAVPATLTLAWLGSQWLLPLPLAISFLVYEALFRARGDRPTTLVLTPERLEVADPLRGQTIAVDLGGIEVTTATWQRTRYGSEVVVLLADPTGPRAAVRFRVEEQPPVAPGHVDADAADLVLGGQGSVLRAVAPFEVIARQRFDDRRGIAFFRLTMPEATWARTGLRLWTGTAPALDAFGYHVTDAEEWLVLDGTRWTLRRAGTGEEVARGDLSSLEVTSRGRSLSLVLEAGSDPELVKIPLLAIALSPELRSHVPAPVAAPLAPERAAAGTDRHTHPAEGAALLWHLLRHAPALPDPLRAAVAAAGLPRERLPSRDEEPPAPRSATLSAGGRSAPPAP
jgi:hypothetical protein